MNLTEAEIAQIKDIIQDRPEVRMPAFRRYFSPVATIIGALVIVVQLGSWGGRITEQVNGLEKRVAALQSEVTGLSVAMMTLRSQVPEAGETK